MATGDLHVERRGQGPEVVLVHGSLATAATSWAKQEPLADRWTLVPMSRRGYPPNPPTPPGVRSDFAVDADDLAVVAGSGAHLVGHSYGALAAVLAAARDTTAVRSLTVVEPPAFALGRGDEGVEARITGHEQRLRESPTPRAFHVSFLRALGAPDADVPDPLPPDLERLVVLAMEERPPWEATLPCDVLRDAGVPVLVVTGGWDPVLELVADRLATAVGPTARREVVPGRGHVVQRTGPPFNDLLERFLLDAEARRPT